MTLGRMDNVLIVVDDSGIDADRRIAKDARYCNESAPGAGDLVLSANISNAER